MGGPSEALTALGSDLAFSVSFAIARELRDQAVESNISQVELVAVVIILTIALDRVPGAVEALVAGVRRLWRRFRSKSSSTALATSKSSSGASTTQRIADFLRLFVDISRRIATSLLIQLVANAIVSREPLRASRVVSLLTITIFFVFLQSGAMFTTPVPK